MRSCMDGLVVEEQEDEASCWKVSANQGLVFEEGTMQLLTLFEESKKSATTKT